MTSDLHRVVTRWDGRQWTARVEDPDGFHVGETTARRLDQVEGKARAVLERVRDGRSGHPDGPDPVELVIDVQLHPDIETDLRDAEDLVADASTAVESSVAALQRAGMATQDIAVLLAHRDLTAGPERDLVVPNAEVAAVALDCRPDAIAVVWDDRGFGVTTYCRECVEADRGPWRDLPHRTSALVYDGPVRCDGCDHDITATNGGEAARPAGVDGHVGGWGRPGTVQTVANESAPPPPPNGTGRKP